MRKWFVILFGILLTGLLLTACAEPEPASNGIGKTIKTDKGQYTDLTVSELQGMLENKDFTFVNVHIPFEGKINPTDAFIPYNEIGQRLDQLPADKNAKIVLYCRSDSMSNDAARTLVDLGYTNIFNLDGGFIAWKAAGLPLDMNP